MWDFDEQTRVNYALVRVGEVSVLWKKCVACQETQEVIIHKVLRVMLAAFHLWEFVLHE